MKIVCQIFLIAAPFTFWGVRTSGVWGVCSRGFGSSGVCKGLAYFLGRLRASRGDGQGVSKIGDAKIAGHCFCVGTNQWREF